MSSGISRRKFLPLAGCIVAGCFVSDNYLFGKAGSMEDRKPDGAISCSSRFCRHNSKGKCTHGMILRARE